MTPQVAPSPHRVLIARGLTLLIRRHGVFDDYGATAGGATKTREKTAAPPEPSGRQVAADHTQR